MKTLKPLNQSQEVNEIPDILNEFRIIKKYHQSGMIQDKDFNAIEDLVKEKILAVCGLKYLEPNQQIFTRIK